MRVFSCTRNGREMGTQLFLTAALAKSVRRVYEECTKLPIEERAAIDNSPVDLLNLR